MWENKKGLGSWSCRDTQLVSALLRPPVTPIAGALAQRHQPDHARSWWRAGCSMRRGGLDRW